MTPSPLPIASILEVDRQRRDFGDLQSLMDSIQSFGLIEPIVVDQSFRLIAGGRRLEAHRRLGLETILCIQKETLSQDHLHELELEENLRRKDFTWQEHCLALANLHRLKTIRLLEEGKAWGQRETGELFGVSVAKVNYTLKLAEELSKKDSPLWTLDSATEGLRWLTKQEEDRAMAELARRQAEQSASNLPSDFDIESLFDSTPTPPPIAVVTPSQLSSEKEAARERYLSNPHNPPDEFESYWEGRQALRQQGPRVVLTPRLHLGCCLDYMAKNESRFDHIITDPPYAIDMEMLAQDGVAMQNIDRVDDEHQVEENVDLLSRFFPLAYSTLKDKGFLILWCDYMMFNSLHDMALSAGFTVQRWPIVWVKTHTCRNAAPQYNFTKTTEIALVCRKGGATLARTAPIGHILAGHDEYKKTSAHPFVKPFEVWKHLVEAVSLEGQSILDPFGGEMTGPTSFVRLNRNFFACEKVPEHFNRGMERLKQYYLSLDPTTTFI